MPSFAEINSLQAKTEGVENNVEFIVNMIEDRGIGRGTRDVVNNVVEQTNNICELAEEMIDKPVKFGRVEKMARNTEAEFMTTVMTIKNKSNRVRSVLDGYKEDINVLDVGEGLNVQKSGHSNWKELRSEYMRGLDSSEGKVILDGSIKRMIHVGRKSNIFHSVSNHLSQDRKEFAKDPGFEYNLLESSSLQSAYSLREGIFNLVNVVWDLGVEVGPNKNNWKSNIQSEADNSEVEAVLGSLLGGEFNEYLRDYRHPDVHDEIVSNVSRENIAEAIAGKPRKHIEKFITETSNIADKLEDKEIMVINQARNELDL